MDNIKGQTRKYKLYKSEIENLLNGKQKTIEISDELGFDVVLIYEVD